MTPIKLDEFIIFLIISSRRVSNSYGAGNDELNWSGHGQPSGLKRSFHQKVSGREAVESGFKVIELIKRSYFILFYLGITKRGIDGNAIDSI